MTKSLVRASLLVAAGSMAFAANSATADDEVHSWTMQSAYPSGDPQYQHFEWWAERVEEHSGGRIEIEVLPAGAIVDAFEVLDATHDGIIDGAHSWSGFWVGKDRAAVIVSSGPAGPFGMDWSDMWGW